PAIKRVVARQAEHELAPAGAAGAIQCWVVGGSSDNEPKCRVCKCDILDADERVRSVISDSVGHDELTQRIERESVAARGAIEVGSVVSGTAIQDVIAILAVENVVTAIAGQDVGERIAAAVITGGSR